eukprot:Tamp_14607.p1 GENE.Tamp_14607~~Tamp_14607.p1  ORF type:complete len:416 (+),score=88.50 Tamp_14607:55-1248(+)
MAGAGSDQAAAPKTAAFPPNGPGLRPEFDGVELLLMDHATPPETLLANLSRLGAVLDSPKDGVPAEIAWPDMTPELAEALSVDSITTWDYDLVKLNQLTKGKPLAPLAFALIESYDLIGKLNLDENTLKRYLVAFESAYNTCMYHNPMHAADVMHAFSYLIRGEIADALTSDELLVALLSGPAHDLGHPGVNNALLVKQKHPVSIKYPTSVLENFHAALAVELMQAPERDVLSFLDATEDGAAKKAELQQFMKDLVLCTDMSLHGSIMDRLKELQGDGKGIDLGVRENRVLALQTLLHAADLSNPCKKWEIHVQWTHAIVAEFFSQGDLERHIGIEVTPMLDRTLNCGRSSQKGFFVHFIRPLFVVCAAVLPSIKDKCDMMTSKLDANVSRWTTLGF